MDFDLLINNIVDKGESLGIDGMVGYERIIFLISEAEVYCDMEGIDSFIDNYNNENLLELVEGYKKIGALELSKGFINLINSQKEEKDAILEQLNDMITSRQGYNYDSIKEWLSSEINPI
ncbi:hypothetical protein E9993_14875 [Labilibacter sediminis]|nr:hypothetical protein E9993_14875 [Labilibacter sediminis]